jgi:uncharacterized protein
MKKVFLNRNLKKSIKFTFILLFFLILLFYFLPASVLAQDIVEKIISSKPEGYVADFAQILSDDDEQQLFILSKIIDDKSKDQIAVVTVDTLGLYSIEEFSYKLLEKWGVGQKELNNGILIVLALKEKKVRIEVGYGLEPLITDSIAALIIQNYGLPYFRESNYGKGLYNMVYQLGNIIAKNMGENFSDWVKEGGLKAQGGNESMGFFFIVLIFIIFFIFSSLLRRPRFYGYRNRSVANQLFGAYLASRVMRNTFFGNNIGNTHNSGFGGFHGGGFGGFGGFGGGSSGGGGATGGW